MMAIAITLVVVGHQSVPFAPHWYSDRLHEWIYAFHMSLFIFLSGLLVRYSYRGVKCVADYGRYVGRRFTKFFFPYLAIGLIVAYATTGFSGGDTAEQLRSVMRNLLLYPMESEASFLWYIYLLMGYYVVVPLLFALPQRWQMVLCLASVGLPLLPAGPMCGASLYCRYTFFFLLGIVCAQHTDELATIRTWKWGLAALPFAAWSVLSLTGQAPVLLPVFTGLLALPACYVCARWLGLAGWLRRTCRQVSEGCYWIYLLQLFVVWGCAYAAIWWLPTGRYPFALFIVVSSFLAISLPLLLRRLALLIVERRKRRVSTR